MSLQTLALATIVAVVGVIQYTLVAQALQDLVHRPRVRGGNKMTWALLVLCVPIAGALLYSSMGPTSFLRHDAVARTRRANTGASARQVPSELSGPRPQNVTPFRPRPNSTVRGRTTARRAGLTRSRAHNTGTLKQMRRTGS